MWLLVQAAKCGMLMFHLSAYKCCTRTCQEHEQASNIHLNFLASCATATVVVRSLHVLRSMNLMIFALFQGGIMVQHTYLMSLKTIGYTSSCFSNPHRLKHMKDLFDSTYCIEQYSEGENPKLLHDIHVHDEHADHKYN